MSTHSSLPTDDVVTRLYLAAEALQRLAGQVPEEDAGFAYILDVIATDVKGGAEELDNAEVWRSRSG